jgi:hypothetical protein
VKLLEKLRADEELLEPAAMRNALEARKQAIQAAKQALIVRDKVCLPLGSNPVRAVKLAQAILAQLNPIPAAEQQALVEPVVTIFLDNGGVYIPLGPAIALEAVQAILRMIVVC